MSDPTIAAWSRENDLLFQLRQLREENERLREDYQGVDAVAALTEDGWTWDGDQWQRPPELNQFKPDYNTEAVLVEEMQRMGAEIAALHIEIDTLHKILITRAEQIVGLQDEIRNLTGEE